MAKKEHHNLKQTNARFSVRGQLQKVGEDKFFNLKPAGGPDGRKKAFAKCTMAVKTSADNVVYGIEISGNEQDTVRYSYKTQEGTQNVDIKWTDRYNEKIVNALIPQGAEAKISFAKSIGLSRETYIDKKDGDKEKERIARKQLTGYDAVLEIKKAVDEGRLADGTSVYIGGNIRPNTFSFKNDDGETITTKRIALEAGSMSLAATPVVFGEMSEEDIDKSSSFVMDVVIKEFNEVDGVIYMTGIYVGYDCIEEIEFKFTTPELANGFKTVFTPHLKKGIYPMIPCAGVIKLETIEEAVTEEVPTGTTGLLGDFKKYTTTRKGKSKQYFVIGGGDEGRIDLESYTVEKVEEAKEQIKAWKNDFKEGKDVADEVEMTAPAVSLGNISAYASDETLDDFDNDEELWD